MSRCAPLLLVLRAEACGAELTPSDGMTLDDWGGAIAEGVVGAGVTVNGNQITWPGGGAKAGAVVRVVRPTGTYDDYTGVGFFADPTLTAPERDRDPRARRRGDDHRRLRIHAHARQPARGAGSGDVIYLGDPPAWPPLDDASLPRRGRAGFSFARPRRSVGHARGPHFRAVDMVSDNRIPPGATATTTYTFAVPPSCAAASVQRGRDHRPVQLALARERGWKTHDYVVATASTSAALP